MSKVAHTPGPWVIETQTKSFEVCTLHGLERQPTEDGLGQAWVYVRPESLFRDGEWHWPDEAEQLANAHLIAAAPELLAALIELRDWYAETTGLPAASANAAILKAEGRQP